MAPGRTQDISKQDIEAMASRIRDGMWTLSGHPEDVFNTRYRVGIIERMRGQHATKTSEKSRFIETILTHMVGEGHISGWDYIGNSGRADYKVVLKSGRLAVIEAKGSMDGNSATILERPNFADELVIWTMTTNPLSDVKANIWSGIHTRISPEHIVAGKRVDTIVALDTLGSSIRLCPGLASVPSVLIGGSMLDAPCLYLLPHELPILGLRNPVSARPIDQCEFALALCQCFKVPDTLVGRVQFEIAEKLGRMARRTTLYFGGQITRSSSMRTLKRDMTAYWAAVASDRDYVPSK